MVGVEFLVALLIWSCYSSVLFWLIVIGPYLVPDMHMILCAHPYGSSRSGIQQKGGSGYRKGKVGRVQAIVKTLLRALTLNNKQLIFNSETINSENI